MQNANHAGSRASRFRAQTAFFAFCLLPFALLGCAARRPGSGAELRQLRADIIAATQRPGVSRASWGVVVDSLDRRDRLFDLNSTRLFVPASIAKLVSVATAAEAVGWDYRFETTLLATGSISEGTLSGDLLIVGSGDPSIGGRGGGDISAFVAALKAAGLTRIEGRIVGDDDALEEPRPQLSWAWDDLGYTTGALFGALNLAENRTVVSVAPGPVAGAPAILSLDTRSVGRAIVNRTVTGPAGSAMLVWPEQRPGEPSLTIAGSIPLGSQTTPLGISTGNPTVWFASVLRSRLLEEGILVTGEAIDVDDLTPPPNRTEATTLFRYLSPTLAEMAHPLLKDSINLYGEAFMRLNVDRGSFPTNDAALEGLRKRLTAWGLPEDSYQLVDGSGLSRRDAISPEAVMMILQRMFDASGASPFLAALPVAGVDGSLATRMKGTAAEGHVWAKTGTMSNIRSLAGYITTQGGERLAFVIVINNFEGTGTDANQAIDAIAVRLAELSRTP
jgi:D-alanyl-D-alanine carboxypeptidase/D-alanyl-D-alanine-endopeptidase (penicillin-binding protein 4)